MVSTCFNRQNHGDFMEISWIIVSLLMGYHGNMIGEISWENVMDKWDIYCE